jgi:hypothetical protein
MSNEAAPRDQLARLSKALLALHKTLLESERLGYEASFGKIDSPATFFNLVMGDPWFAWLRVLSEFIVVLDERLSQKNAPITPGDVRDFAARTRELLTPHNDGLGFAQNYHNAIQRDPDVVLAHAGMGKLLHSLQQD